MICILLWSILNAPNIDPVKPPINTADPKGTNRETSTGPLIEWAKKPTMEFVNIKKAAVAAALLGAAKPVSISNGDSHIPPPIPTKPATTPRQPLLEPQ